MEHTRWEEEHRKICNDCYNDFLDELQQPEYEEELE